MRNHTVEFLGPSEMPPEPSDHLVENQDRAPPLAKFFDAFLIARSRWNCGFRLHKDARDLAGMLIEQLSHTPKVVVGKLHGHVDNSLRDASIHLGAADEPIVCGEEWLIAANRD